MQAEAVLPVKDLTEELALKMVTQAAVLEIMLEMAGQVQHHQFLGQLLLMLAVAVVVVTTLVRVLQEERVAVELVGLTLTVLVVQQMVFLELMV
jgi:hypothetical protein